jgi:hypothetical protein
MIPPFMKCSSKQKLSSAKQTGRARTPKEVRGRSPLPVKVRKKIVIHMIQRPRITNRMKKMEEI